MKFKILSIIILSSILFGTAGHSDEVVVEDHHHASSSSSAKGKRELVPAEIFFLGEIRSKDAASAVMEITYIEQCLHATTLNVMSLLYFKKILESTGCNGCPESYDIIIYLPRFLTPFLYPTWQATSENSKEELYELSLSIYGNKLLNFESIDHFATIDLGQSCIIYKLDGCTIRRMNTTQREERIININEKCSLLRKKLTAHSVSEILRDFFKASAPTLYKAVEDLSKHSKGRLAGVALYFDGNTINSALGRKALTDGDDKDHHIERALVRRLFEHLSDNFGYLFVYTTLPPCNTDATGCVSFYHQLVQDNPRLKVTILFDNEYEDGFDYTSIATTNLILVNRASEIKRLQQSEARKKSITSMSQNLVRATSDQIVNALKKKPDGEAEQILEQFENRERRGRIIQRLSQSEKTR